MAVRSARLAVGTRAATGQSTVYTCPAGKTALLKDVILSSPVGNVTRAVVAVVSGPTQVSLFDTPLGTGVLHQSFFVVLEPGDAIVVYSAGSTTGYWLSGAELDGVAP